LISKILGLHLLAQVPASPPEESHLGVLLYAFGLLLVLFLLINLDRRFRDHAGRSLFRPFNFFADIRDGRMVPNGPTTLLAFTMSGAIGIAVATILHGFASQPGVIQEIALALPHSLLFAEGGSNEASPLIFFTTCAFLAICSLALLLRFCAIFVKGRIYFGDTYNIAVWSLLPVSFLLLFDLILPRMDMDRSTEILSLVILLVIFLWSYFRMMKGTGVLFDIYPTRIYVYGVALLAIVVFIAWIYFRNSGLIANFLPQVPVIWNRQHG
jgi:hypothetical protein